MREKNVDDYLKRLRELHPLQWEQELSTLRPQQYAAYKAKEAAQQEASAQEAYRKNPLSGLTLTHEWYFGGFGNILMANFTIKSLLGFPVKDIKIACHTSGASGTGLSLVVQTIYQAVPAKSTVRFNKVNMGFINSQSTNAGCDFVGVVQ